MCYVIAASTILKWFNALSAAYNVQWVTLKQAANNAIKFAKTAFLIFLLLSLDNYKDEYKPAPMRAAKQLFWGGDGELADNCRR